MKCRRNYKRYFEQNGQAIQYHKCRWNPVHTYPEIELRYHEESCPNQYDVLPEPVVYPKIKFYTPSEAELREFKKLAMESNMIGEDWELDLLLNPFPTFEYNPNGVYEAHRLNQLKLEATIAMREAAEAAEAARLQEEEAQARAAAEAAKSTEAESGEAESAEPQPGPSGTQAASGRDVAVPPKTEKKVPMRYIFYDSEEEDNEDD
jgi:hypothetical protein